MAKVLVIAETQDGQVRKASLSAIAAGQQVATGLSASFDVIAIGQGTNSAKESLSGVGAGKLITAEVEGGYLAERYAPSIAQAVREGAYSHVVSPASAQGKDLMPRVAAKLSAGFAADVIGLEVQDGTVLARRSMYAGNVFTTVTLSTDIQVFTVRQSEFEPVSAAAGDTPVESIATTADPAADRVEFLSLDVVKSERPELTDADVVVSGGRALKSAENFETVLEPLVDSLGAAMGASRAACDAGYVPSDLQVGQTGKVVAPKLYVAVGISGAIQHLAGMKGSKTIVAINKDKEAPIAQVADYFWVADLFDAVPELTAELQKG